MTVNSEWLATWLAMPALQNGFLLARQSRHATSGGQVRVEVALLRWRGFGGSSPAWAEVRSSESGARWGLACTQPNEPTCGMRAVGAEVLFSASLRLRRTTPSGCVGPDRLYSRAIFESRRQAVDPAAICT